NDWALWAKKVAMMPSAMIYRIGTNSLSTAPGSQGETEKPSRVSNGAASPHSPRPTRNCLRYSLRLRHHTPYGNDAGQKKVLTTKEEEDDGRLAVRDYRRPRDKVCICGITVTMRFDRALSFRVFDALSCQPSDACMGS